MDDVTECSRILLQKSLCDREGLFRAFTSFLDDRFSPCVLLYYVSEVKQEGVCSLPLQLRSFTKGDSNHFPNFLPRSIERLIDTTDALKEGAMIDRWLECCDRTNQRRAKDWILKLHEHGVEIILPFIHVAQEESANDVDVDGTTNNIPVTLAIGSSKIGSSKKTKPLTESNLNLLRALRGLFLLALQKCDLAAHYADTLHHKDADPITGKLPWMIEENSPAPFICQHEGVMSDILEQVKKIAVRNSSVLITGETGTGKEEIAKMIHRLSKRAGSLVSVNCSAIPHELFENELFGHERGAYTGATESTQGMLGRAAGGTLFLDEIGDLPLHGQVKLLRLIQEGEYEKIGSTKTLKSDTRFIFATNRNLEQDVKRALFRADLFFRIGTFQINLPPLRERKEDITLFIDHFLRTAKDRFQKSKLRISDRVRERLIEYHWPGNVRELENLILRMVVFSEESDLDLKDLPELLRKDQDIEGGKIQLKELEDKMRMIEKELIEQALLKTEGNLSRAARLLDWSRGALQYKMRSYRLNNEY